MKKLTNVQLIDHAQHATDLRETRDALDGALTEYNRRVAKAFSDLQPFVTAFNERVSEANEFVSTVHDDQQAHFDERSEKWQEGDVGSAYSDWMSQWELAVEEVELEEPGELEMPDVDLDAFADLETECGS